MNQPETFWLRVLFIFTAAGLTAGCMTENPITGGIATKRFPVAQFYQPDADITGSIGTRPAAQQRTGSAVVSLRPPPSPVEIRAQCWMRYEQINANLDTKTALTQQCVNERMGIAPAN
jgi:hypothetical protein